jgi:hypothetical protein
VKKKPTTIKRKKKPLYGVSPVASAVEVVIAMNEAKRKELAALTGKKPRAVATARQSRLVAVATARQSRLVAVATASGTSQPAAATTPAWKITLVFGNATGIYGLANDQRIYRWDTRVAVWVLHKEGISATTN